MCGRWIPGTAVTVSNQTGTARTVSGAEGRYSFGALAPGSWTITFESMGFQTKQQGIRLPENGDTVEHSVKLLPDLMLKEELFVTHSDPSLGIASIPFTGWSRGAAARDPLSHQISRRRV